MSILRKLSDDDLAEGAFAMAAGDARGAQRAAAVLYQEGRVRRNERKVGKALLLRAQADVYVSMMHSAVQHSTRAIELLRSHSEPLLELRALATQSYALASVGRFDEARAGAIRCRSLAEDVGSVDFEALGANYIGVADFWAGHHEGAARAFRSVAENVQEGVDVATLLQSMTNWCFSEVLALQRESLQHPHEEHLELQADTAWELLDRFEELQSAVAASTSAEPEHVVFLTLANAMKALAHLYADDHRASREFAWSMREYITLLPRGSWLRVLPWWYDTESARRLGKAEISKTLARRMRVEAMTRSHRPMQDLAGQFLQAR